MDRRLKLQETLETLMGNRNVYFQPPETVKMKYPCIVYGRGSFLTEFANDLPYTIDHNYTITYMDRDPDSPVIDKLLRLPKCIHSTHFTKDGLNHDVFNLYI